MTRLIRTNLTPVVLVLLAVLPAVMGLAPGVVRCEHPGADTHLAAADHAASPDDAGYCCDHDAPAAPTDDEPCNDSPLEIELAPAPAQHLALDFHDAPPLPVPAWTPAEQHAIDPDLSASRYDLGPPAISAQLAVVTSTQLRL